ncbi:putative mediator of RNA polymerase II transcription subunit 26 [Anopheles darlingi]|uniref:putative mediator of RNA polymerase II transcription subunit 26 n=1 Tax=Anopheles darlingi TaxID=43151 RepID=UPI0021004C87|nr:putative mediator of RNA polymerase II transcription subunit 26 [Anopheles darlingi]
MIIQLFLLLSLGITLIEGDRAPPFKPLLPPSGYTPKVPVMFPSFVPKSHHLVGHHTSGGSLKPYMTQFRAGTRLAPVAIRPAPSMIMSLKRPIKSILSHPSLMKQPLLKRPSPLAFSGTSASIKHHKFLSSPAGPSTGEIVFEKLKPVCITTKLTAHKDGAIHTIPAPNLGLTKSPKAPNQIRVTSYEDSNKLEIEVKTTKPTFTAKPPAYQLHPTVSDPSSVVVGGPYKHHAINHQYQVTEEHSNDVTIGDPFSGKKTYFAPDPDPSLPSKTLIPTSDPLSTPSNGKYAPASDLLLQGHHQQQLHYPIQPQTSASAVIQYVNAVPQGSYAIPLATQPQLQQHILQQTAMLQEMPVSLYNPTYLVTQSNNLFNTHQQQGAVNLFKPDNHFLGALHTQTPAPAVLFNSFGNYKNAEPAASTGQILTATQDQLHELQSVVSQIQLNDIHQLHHHHHPHQQQQQLQEQSVDMPTYAQLVGHEQPAIHQQQLPQLNQLEQQLQQQLIQQHQQDSNGQTQRPMTDAEVAHLLNYGMINLHSNLAPSDYYHYQVDQPSVGSSTAPQQPALHAFYELSERQKENDRILAQAQQDLYQQQQQQQQQDVQKQYQPVQTEGASSDYLQAYQEHQQAVSNILGLRDQPQQLQQAIGSTIAPQTTHSPLRIYVPEEADHEYSNSVHAQKRMDEIDFEYADAEGQIPTEDSKPTVAYEAMMDEDSEPAAEVPEDQEYQQQQSRTEEPDNEEENYTKNLSNHRLE